jgi:hypothetical protein
MIRSKRQINGFRFTAEYTIGDSAAPNRELMRVCRNTSMQTSERQT